MLVFFFPFFFENLGSYVYDSMRARTVLFLKGISAAIFSLRSCTACARVLSLCACLPARAQGRPRRLGCSRSTRRQRRKVDKCRVADKKQTDKQTNKQTNTHYSFIGIDTITGISSVALKHIIFIQGIMPFHLGTSPLEVTTFNLMFIGSGACCTIFSFPMTIF